MLFRSRPVLVKGQELVLNLVKASNHPDILQLGAAVPHHSFLPTKAIQRSISKVARQQPLDYATYEFPPGLLSRSEERRVGKECRSRWSPYH